MRLKFKDIINKHENIPCIVSGHGPSLDLTKEEVLKVHSAGKAIRICVNNWFDYYDKKPDYWVLSNGEFTVGSGLTNDTWWKSRGYPQDAYNQYNIPLFFSSVADLTDYELIDKLLVPDYLPFDTKHFKGDSCFKILSNFRQHYEQNRNLDFLYYGNNGHMWRPANKKAFEEVRCDPVFIQYPAASWSKGSKCCHRVDPLARTIQEELQEYSGYDKHYSTGHTVAVSALSIAVLMGCNPIYLTGVDLDYNLGYAKNEVNTRKYIPRGAYGHFKVLAKHIENDFNIINASAEKKGIKIINLYKDAWYESFEKGSLHVE